jgi:hypothetical protein
MTGTRQGLLVGAIVMGLAGATPVGFAAMSDQTPSDHLRTSSAIVATLIQHATAQSHTFRNLVDAINASDGIVYVEEGTCGHGMRSCFVNVTVAGRNRIL